MTFNSSGRRCALCRALCCALIMAMMFVGCRDAPVGKATDSAALPASDLPAINSVPATGWDSTAGPVLIVAVPRNPASVVIVLPGMTDSTLAATMRFELRELVNRSVDLFGPGGLVGSSILKVSSQPSDSMGCIRWPVGTLAGPVQPGWKVAFEKGRAAGLPLDSLEGMSGPDSVRLVTDIRKAAIALAESSDPAFSGIPFFVRKGYRLNAAAYSVVIGDVIRKINEEANPREEHLFLVAERSDSSAAYRVGFHSRSAGSEESLETSEILAALRLRQSGRLAMAITFEYEDGGKVGLLERLAPNNWKVVWKSAYSGC